METNFEVLFVPRIGRFKSYYVVWKPTCRPDTTMHSRTFKSYYVVWKQKMKIFTRNHSGRFKSYYVVWKQYLMIIIHMTVIRFKSYYVVWKPGERCESAWGCLRLNRTM